MYVCMYMYVCICMYVCVFERVGPVQYVTLPLGVVGVRIRIERSSDVSCSPIRVAGEHGDYSLPLQTDGTSAHTVCEWPPQPPTPTTTMGADGLSLSWSLIAGASPRAPAGALMLFFPDSVVPTR